MDAGHNNLQEMVLLLGAAVFIVAMLARVRLSPVLGYLVAGAAIGPFGMAIAETTPATEALAEFGVIFLLFSIGLELSVERLRKLRSHVFGFGTLQMLLTAPAIAIVAYGLGLTLPAAVIIGGGLALSSTAIVLQLLSEQGIKSSQVGRLSLAVLILQDLAIIPLLVLLNVFATPGEEVASALGRATVQAVAAVLVIVLAGRLLLRPLFRFIVSLGNNELLTATILLIVLATAYACVAMGLSPALGAFVAGLLVAETEFRPQVEADILPFKGLLLGLFFLAVGMSLDLRLLAEEWLAILVLMFGLVMGKALIIALLGRFFRFSLGNSLYAGLMLAQGGEFAFVLFRLASEGGVLPRETAQILMVSVTVSMGLTPLLAELGAALARNMGRRNVHEVRGAAEETRDLSHHVIISGFGRVGHTVARLLEAERIPYVALDVEAELVSQARKAGLPVHFGDASRALVLKAVGLERARAVIITHADTRISERSIRKIRNLNRDLPIIARARDYAEVRALEDAGATLAVAEMFETSLQLGSALLRDLGVAEAEISRVLDRFREDDYARVRGEA